MFTKNFKTYSRVLTAILTAALLSSGLSWGSESGDPQQSKKKNAGRKIASHSPAEALDLSGQGESMARSLTKPSPEFLKIGRKPARATNMRIDGVCRDSYGFIYTSLDKGYVNCLESATRTSSGASVNDYFGSAQRQTGLGLLLSNW
ncbi:MAG: hypothetical protein AB1540_12640 [Bdellovibrionota bacterium]